MFIIDIVIYIFFAWVMYAFAKKSVLYYPNNFKGLKMDKYLWYYIGFFTFISAIRWGVGVDSIDYAYQFIIGKTGHEGYGSGEENELLMSWFVHGIHDSSIHFTIGLGLMAFVQIYFITLALKKHKYILTMVPILMFGSFYYLSLMNGVRQMMVACAFFWASKFILEKKLWKYILFIFIASFIHHSAVMLIPFYFIPKKLKIADKKWICLTIFLTCFILGMTPMFQGAIKYVENLSLLAGYEGYGERVSDFLTTGYNEETKSFGPMQLSYLLVGVFTVWFGPNLKRTYEQKIPSFNLWYFFSFFYISAYFLLCNISHIVLRPVDYFALFHMIIASMVLYELWNSKKKNEWTLKFIFILIIWANIAWGMFKANYTMLPDKREYATYKTFFMHMDEVRKLK